MSESVASILQQGIRSTVANASEHLIPERRDALLGVVLSGLGENHTGETVLTLACYADAMRVVFTCLPLAEESSKEVVDQAEDFLLDFAASLAKVREEYARFATLRRVDVDSFVKQYREDSGSFGWKDESTKWSSITVCQNIANECGDSAILDALRDTFVKAAETLLLANSIDDRPEVFLNQLKAELGFSASTVGQQHAVSEQLLTPLIFPVDRLVECCAFSPKENLLAIGSSGTVSLWNTDTRSLLRLIRVKRNAKERDMSLAFSKNGQEIAVAFSNDPKVRVFDVSTGDRVCLLHEGGEVQLWGVSSNGLLITSSTVGSDDKNVNIWNLLTAEKISSTRVSSQGYSQRATSVAIDASGAFATVARENDEDLRIFDLASSARVGTCWGAHECRVEIVVSGADSGTIFSIDKEGGLALWRLPSGEVVRRGKAELGWPKSMILTPCGTRLIISGWSNLETERGVIIILEAENFAVLHRIPVNDFLTLTVSADGNLLAAGPFDSGLVVIDLRSENYSLDNVVNIAIPDISDQSSGWDEDDDPIAGEEEVTGVFDPKGWTLSTEGEVDWVKLLDHAGAPVEASFVNNKEWQAAQAENRVLTIEHTGDGMEYIGRVGLYRGQNFGRVIFDCSLPHGITVINVDPMGIDCDYSRETSSFKTRGVQLILYCLEGNLTRAKRLISSSDHWILMSKDADMTPLRAAIRGGHPEIVRLLVKSGLGTDSEPSAWIFAMRDGEWEIADLLVELGFKEEALATLVQASHAGECHLVEHLISRVDSLNQSINLKSYRDLEATPLTAAAMAGHRDVVELLLEAGADIQKADGRNITPWVAAASRGDHELCEFLEARGATADIQLAFVLAADRCKLDVLESLRDQVDINKKQPLGSGLVSALEAAIEAQYASLDFDDASNDSGDAGKDAEKRKDNIVQWLLLHGSDPNTVSENGEPVLHQAVHHCQHEQVSMLLRAGADSNAINASGVTALILAVEQCSNDSVGRLLFHGANPDATDRQGCPAVLVMFDRCSCYDCDSVTWFICYGVDLTATGPDGMTLEEKCEQMVDKADREYDKDEWDFAEAPRSILATLRNQDRMQRWHGVFKQSVDSSEILARVLAVCLEAFTENTGGGVTSGITIGFNFVTRYTQQYPSDAVGLIAEFLDYKDWHYRFWAAMALNEAVQPLEAVLPLVIGHLDDPDQDVAGLLYLTIYSYANSRGVSEGSAIDQTVIDAVLKLYGQCPMSAMQHLMGVLLQIDPECGVKLERHLRSMLPDQPDATTGVDRLRVGMVFGLLGVLQRQNENTEEAIRLFETSVFLCPDQDIGFWEQLAELKLDSGDHSLYGIIDRYGDAVNADNMVDKKQILEELVDLSPAFPWVYHNLAWILATDGDQCNRDGDRAVELAAEACERNGWHHHELLATLAAAFAESGAFDQAVEYIEKAIAAAPEIMGLAYQVQLIRYQNDQAPPLDDGYSEDENDSAVETDDDPDAISEFANSDSILAFLNAKTPRRSGPSWLREPAGTVANSIGMKLVPIEPGEFQMGDPNCEEGEDMCHLVKVTKPFLIGMFPVTQGEYYAVTGMNPSCFLGKNRPVDQLTWREAKRFCELLSQMPSEQSTARRYRLPTEAEWEYACRAGSETDFHFGECPDAGKANFSNGCGQDRPQPTLPVGSFRPNAWGLYDTHGNVWEWCSDWFSTDYFEESPVEDPTGPIAGNHHALRGGAASNGGYECVSYMRGEASRCDGPSPHVPAWGTFELLGDFGLRVVCEIDPDVHCED